MPSSTIEIRPLTGEELELDDTVHGQCFERGDRSEIEARQRWRRPNSHRLANFGPAAAPGPPAHVRAAAREDWPQIRSIYTRFARGYRGMIARDEQQWNALLAGDDRYVAYSYLYEEEGRAEGYLVYTGERLRGEETVLNEFICLT